MSPEAEPNLFRNPMAYPPGGKYFIVLDTPKGPHRIESSSFYDLEMRVFGFCDANSLPRPSAGGIEFEKYVMAQMCPELPDGFCTGRGKVDRGRFRVSLSSVYHLTRLIFNRARAGSRSFYASEDEAERRAAICASCPLNNRDIGCTTCNGLLGFVQLLIGRRRTTRDKELGVCELCGCLLQVKVHISEAALRESIPAPLESDVPGHCWLRGVYGMPEVKAEEDSDGTA